MGDVGRPFRAIAPRNNPGEGGGGHLPGGSSGGPPPDDGRMKRASTACKECQKRRTRCSGQPCSECQAHNRECVFDELSDRRRKANAKKTKEELTSLQKFVEDLLGALRSSDGALVQHIVNTIRAGASEDEIRAVVRQAQAHAARTSNPHDMDPNIINDHMSNFFEHH
ncbi:hypothetical protein N7468_010062 [Penicillium chermesinum]|uniref:Zn(2)-C6 fungal-type domain-containing protein n=1 Tax=Penicillium chermesinum TaxID=63820 RepID=A0A9W9TC62_9EURO|nr:uncharacterized protein N7468_010062 [Penicillium chermesinum]KAJ5217054.1 hypothetical protein N7468_010062 [Penicillium chermesinum]